MRVRIMGISMLLVIAAIAMQLGCKAEPETSPTVESSTSNRWLELLRVLPEKNVTLKAAYLRDTAYMLEKIPAPEYALGHGLPMFRRYGDGDAEWKATLGFVAADVDQTVYAGTSSPPFYVALRGRFSKADVDNAVKTGPLNEILETVSYQGRRFYIWGADNEFDLSRRSNVRPIGEGGRLALVGDFILWMRWTDGIKEMIDAHDGNIRSLADNEDYKLLADGLVQLDTVSAFFSSEPQTESRLREVHGQQIQEMAEVRDTLMGELSRQTKLKPYQALATGAGKDDNGYYLAVALANPDETTARENAKLLEQITSQAKIVLGRHSGEKWSDYLEGSEVKSNGRLTLAKLYGPAFEQWYTFDMGDPSGQYEPLLLHE
jgi:hypothetical protein